MHAPEQDPDTADYIEGLLRDFEERRKRDERFAAYVARADEEWLTLAGASS